GHVFAALAVEPALEDELRRGGVDHLLATGARDVGVEQGALGPGGAEALVPGPGARRAGQRLEGRPERGEEALDLAGAVADGAVELEREADDDGAGLEVAGEGGDGRGVLGVALAGEDLARGGDRAARVGHGDADRLAADVEAEGAHGPSF